MWFFVVALFFGDGTLANVVVPFRTAEECVANNETARTLFKGALSETIRGFSVSPCQLAETKA